MNTNPIRWPRWLRELALVSCLAPIPAGSADTASPAREYPNTLTLIRRPRPLLADYPRWVEPIREKRRWEAPELVADEKADLAVRAWRWSYNARGIIEIPNRLRARETAIIMVHPWGIDDGQGWDTPEPAGVADFCTPEKNQLAAKHTADVINPFLKSLRGKVGLVLYSLPGRCDPIRRQLYRSFHHQPDTAERKAGADALRRRLRSFDYRGQPLPERFQVSESLPVADYFRKFPGLDASARYNNEGFWALPIPVTRDIDVFPNDVVAYDDEGYEALRTFLRTNGIRHVLLTGYATDMCYARTCAGYENLSRDFNTFLVGDATLATFPAHVTPRFATSAHIAFASLNQLVTQLSWIRPIPARDRMAIPRPLPSK